MTFITGRSVMQEKYVLLASYITVHKQHAHVKYLVQLTTTKLQEQQQIAGSVHGVISIASV